MRSLWGRGVLASITKICGRSVVFGHGTPVAEASRHSSARTRRRTAIRRFALVLIGTVTIAGGCAGMNPSSGRVGPVEWVVADMTRTAESGLLRWTYRIRLTEMAGHTITFTKIRITQIASGAHPDAFYGGSQERPFVATLGAQSELKISMTQTMTVPPSLLVGSSITTRAALTKRLEFVGTDESGKAVSVPVFVTFDPR